MALRAAALLLSVTVGGLAWVLGDGPAGLGYIGLYTLLLVPGLPVGFYLFGRRHPVAWITGALIGYALSAVALWVPIDLGYTAHGWLATAWSALTAATFAVFRVSRVAIHLPAWNRADTIGLLCVLLVVPVLLAAPFSRVGERDSSGNQRYRAYFTADFLWHVALTSELTKADPPIRNPYLERRALNYYWAYFVPPAMIARIIGTQHSLEACLLLNALCAGLLFVASIYLYGWCVIPRAGPAAAAVLLTMLAASAEGLFALARLLREGRHLSALRELNVDAMTAWVFHSLTIDSLPRSLWYTPQHATACALGLVALIVPATAGPGIPPTTALVAGIPLGLSIIVSPFLGGVFCVVFGLTAIWISARRSERPLAAVARFSAAAVPPILGLGWCVANQTFEGVGGSLAFGLSERAAAAPLTTLALAVGPVIVLALSGFWMSHRREHACQPAVVGLVVSIVLFYFVSLSNEPVWIGWRAGQILLVTAPPLMAAFFARLIDVGRTRLAVATGAIALAVGMPTAVIDAWNAQDVENVAMGPGFRWTVVVPPDTQAAARWMREHTPPEAVVQMSIGPRGRETWTLIPSFALRRMAAGRPISLLQVPEYDEQSRTVDDIFRTTDAREAWRIARAQRIDYVFLDAVERQAFGAAAAAKFEDPRLFLRVFKSGDAAVFQVR